MTTFSSPNRMLWQLAAAMRRAASRANVIENEGEMKQEVLVCTLLAIAVVESFLNLFFRVLVEDEHFSQHKDRILKDLAPPFLGLERKIREWPEAIFGGPLEFESGLGKEFMELKSKRNALMHFQSSFSSFSVPGIAFEGFANTDVFDSLIPPDAARAVQVAEGMVAEILRRRGLPEHLVGMNVRLWLGAN